MRSGRMWGPPVAHPTSLLRRPISCEPPQDSQQAREPEECAVLEAKPWGCIPWGGVWGLGVGSWWQRHRSQALGVHKSVCPVSPFDPVCPQMEGTISWAFSP